MRESYIYIVKSPNISTQYIGGTFLTLNKRFSHHKSQYNTTSSKIIIDAGDSSIELYEIFNCNTKLELYKREEEIKQLLILQGIVFCNKNKSGIDAINNPEYNKVRYKAYENSHKEQRKAYYNSHKEQKKEYYKLYYLKKKQLRNN